MTSEEAWKLAFEAIAVTHAKHWNKGGAEYLKGVDWMNGENREGWETPIKAAIRGWSQVEKSWMSERVVAVITNSLNEADFDKAIASGNERPKSLCHGDFHAKNGFWCTKENKIVLCDFSEVGYMSPMSDLV